MNLPGYSAENVGSLEVTLQEDGSLFYPAAILWPKWESQESITFVKLHKGPGLGVPGPFMLWIFWNSTNIHWDRG